MSLSLLFSTCFCLYVGKYLVLNSEETLLIFLVLTDFYFSTLDIKQKQFVYLLKLFCLMYETDIPTLLFYTGTRIPISMLA